MTFIIILALVALVVFWGIGIQRKLVSQDEKCENSMSQIGVQQRSRWDAITALVDITKSYNEHEYNTLRDIIKMRRDITGTSSADDANEQEAVLGKALTQIKLVAEQYPDLKASENYGKLMDSLNGYEDKVRISRMVYNDTVTAFNSTVRQFPSSIVANMLGFTKKNYLADPGEKAEMPSIKF